MNRVYPYFFGLRAGPWLLSLLNVQVRGKGQNEQGAKWNEFLRLQVQLRILPGI